MKQKHLFQSFCLVVALAAGLSCKENKPEVKTTTATAERTSTTTTTTTAQKSKAMTQNRIRLDTLSISGIEPLLQKAMKGDFGAYDGKYDTYYEGNEVIMFPVIAYSVQQKGFRPLSDSSFRDRVQSIFGIDLSKHNPLLTCNKTYCLHKVVYANGVAMGLPDYYYEPFAPDLGYTYFDLVNNIVMKFECGERYLELAEDKEHYQVVVTDDLFHFNNFLFHESNASLTWLINKNYRYIESLVRVFGYDKNPRINEAVVNNTYRKWRDHIESAPNNYEVFAGVFSHKDAFGKLHIHGNLMQQVVDQAKPAPEHDIRLKHLAMLYDYGLTILNPSGTRGVRGAFDYLTKAERYRIAAHVAYYIQLYYDLPQYVEGNPLPVDLYRRSFLDDEKDPEFMKVYEKEYAKILEGKRD